MGGLKPLILATTHLIIIILALPNASPSFLPSDNYLINCGSVAEITLDDGRIFKSDPQASSYLSTDEDILTSVTPSSSSSLYATARIFPHDSMYRFLVYKPGRHFIRLYFQPLPHPTYNLTTSTFTVTANDVVLLHGFSLQDKTKTIFKEYIINVTSDNLTLKFSPMKNSIAFINAIEFVSAPNDVVPSSASSLSPAGDFNTLDDHALEVSYRLNVGGSIITPVNDTLSRTWLPDTNFMTFPEGSRNASVPPNMIKYPKGGATPLIAPPSVYSTADQMADSGTSDPNFNLTWSMNVDPSFSYFIRLHFCDIVSKGLNELYFNVYINGIMGASNLDLSTLTSGLSVPFYKDFVLNATSISNGSILIQVGPTSNLQTNIPNAILNGVEVMKMSNSQGSLDGLFGDKGVIFNSSVMKVVTRVALSLVIVAFLMMVIVALRWCNRPKGGYQKQKTFSSWLLPLNSSHCSFLSSKSKTCTTNISSSFLNLGRFFTFNELCQATNNFDEKTVVGVGGFGKVYLGEIENGTKVAVKRGNPSSSQGMNEFQTEIELLSKLRHRHLVSLIGYCDEQAEMILVYEYMSNGPLRDHLYGTAALHPLSWRRRLEICIGAARGLHYLHTGSSQGIIHRDVKTTNILLDENFVAKVSDFGLSKTGPGSLEQTHVSTAVKGSFGYLDPEYFRRQQLTEKSDVYSFGVVLFEVLCARPALDPCLVREQVNLAEWAKIQNGKGAIKKIVDGVIVEEISEESLVKFVEAAEKCLAESGADRPSMGDVLWNLECALQLLGDRNGRSEDSGVAVAAHDMFIQNVQGR